MNGQAFEFTPGGVQPLQASAPAAGIIPAGEAVRALRAQGEQNEKLRTPPDIGPKATEVFARVALTSGLNRRSFTKELRERLRVVRAELKALRRLEREEAELKRLLAAAKAPPAAVTHITSARKSG
jgi:hypothetical protein